MKLYLSGPMTGRPNNNQEAFAEAAAELRKRGHEVVSPPELDHNKGQDLSGDGLQASDEEWAGFVEEDLKSIDQCDGVVFLFGWDTSGGAGREGKHAIELGLELYLWAGPMHPIVSMPWWYFNRYATTERYRP